MYRRQMEDQNMSWTPQISGHTFEYKWSRDRLVIFTPQQHQWSDHKLRIWVKVKVLNPKISE